MNIRKKINRKKISKILFLVGVFVFGSIVLSFNKEKNISTFINLRASKKMEEESETAKFQLLL
ncbi:hypothetical protein NE452_18035, partial [Paeniclostridium sordellii]|uniref:hypothetical protein n=1 Tax=Paraclostridium sordellii TaxID=1505 RepID=UPI00210EAA89